MGPMVPVGVAVIYAVSGYACLKLKNRNRLESFTKKGKCIRSRKANKRYHIDETCIWMYKKKICSFFSIDLNTKLMHHALL